MSKPSEPSTSCCDCHRDNPLAYTLTEAARIAGCSESTLRKHISSGTLIAHYPNSRPLIAGESLLAWIEELPTESPKLVR